MEAGQTYDALIDMTGCIEIKSFFKAYNNVNFINKGGIQESFDFIDMSPLEKDKLWEILLQSFSNHSIISSSISVNA